VWGFWWLPEVGVAGDLAWIRAQQMGVTLCINTKESHDDALATHKE